MVTPRHHYVEWRSWDDDKKLAGDLAALELYDNQIDPDENVNAFQAAPGRLAVRPAGDMNPKIRAAALVRRNLWIDAIF